MTSSQSTDHAGIVAVRLDWTLDDRVVALVALVASPSVHAGYPAGVAPGKSAGVSTSA